MILRKFFVQGWFTPSKTTVNASGEEQVEDISPTTLEVAKTLSRVASQKPKSIDKGMSTVSGKVSTVSGQVSTDSIKKSIPSPDKGQREGKAPMIIEEAPKKTKEQILQEEPTQRLTEEEELNEQQKQRRTQVQFEAQYYTDEDWDLIRAKIKANAELSKSVLGSGLQGEDFAKKMVELLAVCSGVAMLQYKYYGALNTIQFLPLPQAITLWASQLFTLTDHGEVETITTYLQVVNHRTDLRSLYQEPFAPGLASPYVG
ncbi:hypothetical protein Tco_0320234 [Tanacetum coccineum]